MGRTSLLDEGFSGLPDWLPAFPPVSPSLCARAFVACGWTAVEWDGLHVMLEGPRGQRICIPREEVLDHEAIARLVRSAGLRPLEFIDALETVCERSVEEESRKTGIRRKMVTETD